MATRYFVKQPSVDIVIVNWNYARFVTDAIQSVKDQSYQDFRCIVVDNDSEDGSVDRIGDAIDGHPQFSLLRSSKNLGHLGASLWALEHVIGEFVTFLDADDVLFPAYLESHLQAHLAATNPVSFTSSNCVDTNAEGTLLTGGNFNLNQFWQHHGEPALRPLDRAMRLSTVGQESYVALASAVRYLPAHFPYWCWCPGSSNMYRRVMLDRTRPKTQSPTLFGGTDSFFLPILHALTGSVLIDHPLSAYRVHGSNDHSALPGLRNIWHLHSRGEAISLNSYVRMLSWLVDHVDEVSELAGAGRYWRVFDTAISTDWRSRQAFCSPDLIAALARQYPRFVELFGGRRVFAELRKRLRLPEYLKVVSLAHGRPVPFAALGRTLGLEILRQMQLS